MLKILPLVLAIFLSACGSSGGDNDQETTQEQVPDETETLPSGGTPSSPTEIDLNSEYSFSNDSFYNYFRYSGFTGEKLVIHTELNTPLSDTEKSRCASNSGRGSTPSSYDTQIHVYDAALTRIDGICGENLIFNIPDNGIYLIRPDYQSTNSGSIFFSSVIGDSFISSPYGELGQPSNPAPIDFASSNILSSNTFFNYFSFTASAGQKLIVSVVLATPLSTTQKTRCASNSGQGSTPSSYDTQIHVYDSQLNRVDGICGESLEFSVPASGTYMLHFSFAKQSLGYFNAALVN